MSYDELWYVRRNGETTGPWTPAQVLGWVRGGMTDAEVMGMHGQVWIPLEKSPWAGHTPRGKRAKRNYWILLAAIGFPCLWPGVVLIGVVLEPLPGPGPALPNLIAMSIVASGVIAHLVISIGRKLL